MKKWVPCLLVLVLCCSVLCKAQSVQEQRDSLINVYESLLFQRDSARALLDRLPNSEQVKAIEEGLLHETLHYFFGSREDGEVYVNRVASLVDTLRNRGDRNTPCLRYLLIVMTPLAGRGIRDSLYHLAEQLALEANDSLMLSMNYFYQSKEDRMYSTDSLLLLANKGLAVLPQKYRNTVEVGLLINQYYVYLHSSREEQALNTAHRALRLSDEHDNSAGLIMATYALANYYEYKVPKQAIVYLQEGIERYKNMTGHIHPALSNTMANMLDEAGRHSEALHYYRLAMEENERQHRQASIYVNLGNIAFVMNELAHYDSALAYARLALDYCQKEQLVMTEQPFQVLSTAWNKLGRMDSAILYAHKGISIARRRKDDAAIFAFYQDLLLCHARLEQKDSARKYAAALLQFADSTEQSESHKYDHYLTLSLAHEYLEEPGKAYKYLKQANALRDSLDKVKTNRAIIELQTEYETKEKEAQIVQLHREKEAEVQARRQLIGVISIISVLLLALAYFVWRYYRAQARLAATGKVKDRMLSLLAHDVRAPLQGLLSLVYLNRVRPQPPEKQQEHLATIEDKVGGMLKMIDGLLLWSRRQLSGDSTAPEEVPISSLFAELQEQFRHQIAEQNISIREDIQASHLKADPEVLRLVLRNLLSNALKYTPAGGEVVLGATRTGQGRTRISVQDSGVGLQKGQITAIEEHKVQESGPGLLGEKGKGIGLKLVQEFLALAGSRLHVENRQDGGAVFSFEL